MLIKLCTNISFSIGGILIPHTDQGHSDYYTLLKINLKNDLVLEICCRDVCPSLKLQQEGNGEEICVYKPWEVVLFVLTIGSHSVLLFSLYHNNQVSTTDLKMEPWPKLFIHCLSPAGVWLVPWIGNKQNRQAKPSRPWGDWMTKFAQVCADHGVEAPAGHRC